MHLPELPFPVIYVTVGQGQLAMAITVPMVEGSLIHLPIRKLVLALPEFAATHEFAYILVLIRVFLQALPMLQVLFPLPLIVVPIFNVFVNPLPRGLEILNVAHIVAAVTENKNTIAGLAPGEKPLKECAIVETHSAIAICHALLDLSFVKGTLFLIAINDSFPRFG